MKLFVAPLPPVATSIEACSTVCPIHPRPTLPCIMPQPEITSSAESAPEQLVAFGCSRDDNSDLERDHQRIHANAVGGRCSPASVLCRETLSMGGTPNPARRAPRLGPCPSSWESVSLCTSASGSQRGSPKRSHRGAHSPRSLANPENQPGELPIDVALRKGHAELLSILEPS